MSRILADKVTNYNNDGPFEAEQGIDIPLSRPLQIGGFGGLSGQYLASTGAGLTWTTFPELFSGDYDDLTNKPVLFSGNFDDLNNKPAIPPFNINTPSIGEGLVYNGAFWENVALPTAYQYSIYGEQVGPNEVTVNLSDQFGATSFTTFAGTNGIEVSYNPSTDYIEIYSPNVVEYDAGTAKDDVSEMFLNGTKIGLSYTYNSITKTMDTVVNFPSVDVYSLSGDSSQANQARINLDADLSGNQGYVDIVGQDGVLINWDGASSTITLSKTSDDPYVLPPATTAVLGGVIADGTTITVDVEGRISANVSSLGYDDFSVGGEQAPSGNGELSYDNTTGQFTYTPPLFSVEDLNGVSLSSSPPTQNNVFYWNGASWSDADVNTLVSVSINDITDTFVSNPQLNDYLVYNGASWQNTPLDISSKSIHEFVDVLDRVNDDAGQILLWTGGVWESKEYNLDSINNVNASSPSDGDYLRYNQTTGNWETTSATSSVSQLDDLSDVSAGSPSESDFLVYSGGSWINSPAAVPQELNDLSDVSAAPAVGDVLGWDGNDWVAQPSGTSPGAGLTSRTTVSGTTSSIADGVSENLDITAFRGYNLFKIDTSHAAWVTVYCSNDSRTNDSSRSETTDPFPGSGVIAEVITTGEETILVSPGVVGFNNDSPVAPSIPIKVVNKSGASAAITVTLTVLQTEA